MGNGLTEVVIFWKVRAQQKKGCRLEGFWSQIVGLHPDRLVVNEYGKLDACIFQIAVILLVPFCLQGLVLVANLVVIAILPKDADTD